MQAFYQDVAEEGCSDAQHEGRIITSSQICQEGSNQGLRQRVGEVIVRVLDTRGVEVGPDYGSLVDARVDDSAGEFTGDVPVAIPPSWGRTAKVCIRQTLPYPMTVLGVIPEVKVGG